MPSPLLYEIVLGETIGRLAQPIRDFHLAPAPARFEGRAVITRGRNPLSRLVASLVGLPRQNDDAPVTIEIARDAAGTETWRRTFSGKPFTSRQYAGSGTRSGLMVEQIGPMTFAYALSERGGELHLDVRSWRAFGVPMPAFLRPRAIAFEHAADGRFNFDVDMRLPWLGRIMHYRGWLEPVA